MDRALIMENLAKAEEHVVLGQEHVWNQRKLVSRLERDGHDTTTARALLGLFENLLALHIEDRDRLARDLAATERDTSAKPDTPR